MTHWYINTILFIGIPGTADSYQIWPNDMNSGDNRVNQLTFFAFSQPTKENEQIKYYIDSLGDRGRKKHRISTDLDQLAMGGSSGWKEESQFWAFTEQKPHSQAYTVLQTKSPIRSQIVLGNNVQIKGWAVHSVFWAYSVPGNFLLEVSYLPDP